MKIFGRLRFAEQVPLPLVAAVLPQKPQLVLGLDPLGDNADPHRAGQGDNRGGDCRIVGVAGDVTNETAVDFQGPDGKFAEITEG